MIIFGGCAGDLKKAFTDKLNIQVCFLSSTQKTFDYISLYYVLALDYYIYALLITEIHGKSVEYRTPCTVSKRSLKCDAV